MFHTDHLLSSIDLEESTEEISFLSCFQCSVLAKRWRNEHRWLLNPTNDVKKAETITYTQWNWLTQVVFQCMDITRSSKAMLSKYTNNMLMFTFLTHTRMLTWSRPIQSLAGRKGHWQEGNQTRWMSKHTGLHLLLERTFYILNKVWNHTIYPTFLHYILFSISYSTKVSKRHHFAITEMSLSH